jgi:hypothetical protein
LVDKWIVGRAQRSIKDYTNRTLPTKEVESVWSISCFESTQKINMILSANVSSSLILCWRSQELHFFGEICAGTIKTDNTP